MLPRHAYLSATMLALAATMSEEDYPVVSLPEPDDASPEPVLTGYANAQPWDPAPPLRMGPQRCLSSRETIERLSTALPGLLPAEPYQVERTLKRAAMHWRDAFARDFPDRRVWMGGDYIDDGTSRG